MIKSQNSYRFVLLALLLLLISRSALAFAQTSYKTVEYTSEHLRDPFEASFKLLEPTDRQLQSSRNLPHLKVQGVVWGTNMPQAIINDKVVRAGDVIEEAQVLDIRKEGVYVLYQNQQYILKPEIPK